MCRSLPLSLKRFVWRWAVLVGLVKPAGLPMVLRLKTPAIKKAKKKTPVLKPSLVINPNEAAEYFGISAGVKALVGEGRLLMVGMLALLISSIALGESQQNNDNQREPPSHKQSRHYQQQLHRINVPAMNAADALTELAYQTNAVLLFPYQQAKTLQANKVVGRYTVQQAITLLLKDSGLSSSLTKAGAIKISVTGDSRFQNSEGIEMNSKKKVLASVVSFFMGGSVPGVMAQEVSGEETAWLLEEVVVTAQKREQRLIDVPISISALSEEVLDKKRILNLVDLGSTVPNLTVLDFGPGVKKVIVRGVSPLSGSTPAVGLYLDEIPLATDIGLALDLQVLDLQRVEVLKGPQGTLYGQGSIGGTVRYITNDPSLDAVEGQLGVSVYNTSKGGVSEELTGILNLPIP